MLDLSRVQKELVECNRDKQISGVSISLPDGSHDLSHLTGSISGPVSSPYEGGTFTIDIRLPSGYPFEPPKMQFVTKVWHPNISSQNGAICLDILKDQWSPALTLKTALLSLQALLSAPAPDDPQDAVVAQQYLRDYPKFVSTARHWTEAFAKITSLGIEEKIQRLVEMGFPEDLVRSTLKSVNGDENLALERGLLIVAGENFRPQLGLKPFKFEFVEDSHFVGLLRTGLTQLLLAHGFVTRNSITKCTVVPGVTASLGC